MRTHLWRATSPMRYLARSRAVCRISGSVGMGPRIDARFAARRAFGESPPDVSSARSLSRTRRQAGRARTPTTTAVTPPPISAFPTLRVTMGPWRKLNTTAAQTPKTSPTIVACAATGAVAKRKRICPVFNRRGGSDSSFADRDPRTSSRCSGTGESRGRRRGRTKLPAPAASSAIATDRHRRAWVCALPVAPPGEDACSRCCVLSKTCTITVIRAIHLTGVIWRRVSTSCRRALPEFCG